MPKHPSTFVLHVGAHKTATTHLQNSLVAAKPDLARAGIRFHGPRRFRWGKPTLLEQFGIAETADDAPPPMADTALQSLSNTLDRLVVSEENFSGSLVNKKSRLRRPLYPDLPRRLAQLAERAMPLDVALGIRVPTRLINSAYSQTVLVERQIALDAYVSKNRIDLVDWVGLASRILDTPGVRSLTIWRHEDYGAVFPQICKALLGPNAPEISPVSGRWHPGLSKAAIDAVLTGLPVEQAMTDFPLGKKYPAFDAFPERDHRLSDQYYRAQLRQLDKMPGVKRLTAT